MKNLDFEQIGRKIRERRLSLGYTQEYVANMVDINTSHISNIENNRVKISLTTLVNICNVLHTTVDYILSHEYLYENSALNNEILKELEYFSSDKKEKILQIIKIL